MNIHTIISRIRINFNRFIFVVLRKDTVTFFQIVGILNELFPLKTINHEFHQGIIIFKKLC